MHLHPFKLERFFVPFEFSAKYMLNASDCQSVTIGAGLALERMLRNFYSTPGLFLMV
ncbi:hypothetical protein [Herpetosiphon gulosus]|uniref:Uncharacterized protein n=1 Tax=Herpetosiphon gulosus TaxID=1973496 RepID=A0ABP9WW20_9CHLR